MHFIRLLCGISNNEIEINFMKKGMTKENYLELNGFVVLQTNLI